MFPHKLIEQKLKKGSILDKRKKQIVFLSICDIILFIIHLFFGISSFFKMLYEKCNINLYYRIFWDYEKSTYKSCEYMNKAIAYHMNPIYCILISEAIAILSVLYIFYQKKLHFKANSVLFFICITILLITFIITLGVVYCYFDEMSHEVV
jgi:hypothetical protein